MVHAAGMLHRLACAAALLPALLPAAAAAQTAIVSLAECRYLTRHVPAADVAYQAGVDVYGRKVAPADLDATPGIQAPREPEIWLTAPLAKFLAPGTLPEHLTGSEVQLGRLQVDTGSGLVRYDGRPLSDPETAGLVAVCRELMP